KVDVGQQRADHRTLRRAPGWRPSLQPRHDVLLEPAMEQGEKATIADPFLYPFHQWLVRDRVEVALQVGIDHEGEAFLEQTIYFAQRVTAAAPRLARTRVQAAARVAGAYTLSIRLYQRPPLTPLTSADTMRSVHTEASTHDHTGRPSASRVSAPRLAGSALVMLSCLCVLITHPPSCPPSLDPALLTGPLATAAAAVL